MHLITSENYLEAAEAIRDILMMYVEMADGYKGFGHASNVHIRFDPLRFIDAETDDKVYYIDLDLLRSSSAIAILCTYYDLWMEEDRVYGHSGNERYQSALDDGRLSAFPDIEAVIREALSRGEMSADDPWFDEAVVPIYRKYVRGFSGALPTPAAPSGRNARFPSSSAPVGASDHSPGSAGQHHAVVDQAQDLNDSIKRQAVDDEVAECGNAACRLDPETAQPGRVGTDAG